MTTPHAAPLDTPHPTPSPAPRPLRRRPRSLWLAATVGLFLAACGDGGGGAGPIAAPPPPPAPAPPPPAAAYSTLQPAGGGTGIEGRTSMIVTDGSPEALMLDDFQVPASGDFTQLAWQGVYCVQISGATAPAPIATSFVVRLYADVGGAPDLAAPLLEATYPVADTGQTLDANVGGLDCGSATNVEYALYDYAVTLPSAFSAESGTTYWLSIQATGPSYSTFWGWRGDTSAAGSSEQRFNGQTDLFNLDRAFALQP